MKTKHIAASASLRIAGTPMLAQGLIRRASSSGLVCGYVKLRRRMNSRPEVYPGPGTSGSDTHRCSVPGASFTALVEYGSPDQLDDLFPEWLQRCDLVVWETNSAVELLDPDVLVFIDMEGTGSGKNPELALRADLVVEAPLTEEPGAVLCDLVLELAGFPGIRAVSTGFKCWLRTARGPVLGTGIARLLGHIAESGSISSGSRLAGISYRRAWTLLSRAEANLGARLVTRTRGGRDSGGSRLTLLAQRLIKDFKILEETLQKTRMDVEEK